MGMGLRIALLALVTSVAVAETPAPMTRARYRVLPGGRHGKLAFNVVDFTYGLPWPGVVGGVTWQLEAFADAEASGDPLFQLRCLTWGDPLSGEDKPLEFLQYQLRIPAVGETGFVHEGRYQLGEFNEFARASTGLERVHTPEEMFRYYFAFMRGAARHFDTRTTWPLDPGSGNRRPWPRSCCRARSNNTTTGAG